MLITFRNHNQDDVWLGQLLLHTAYHSTLVLNWLVTQKLWVTYPFTVANMVPGQQYCFLGAACTCLYLEEDLQDILWQKLFSLYFVIHLYTYKLF